MRLTDGLLVITVCFFINSISQCEESALRGADLSHHVSGPETTIESIKGKVVLFEYGGAY